MKLFFQWSLQFFLLHLIQNQVIGQDGYDKNWLVGYPDSTLTYPLLHFGSNGLEMRQLVIPSNPPIDFAVTTNASTSNKYGEPQFFTTGCKVISLKTLEIMDNGTEINSPGEEYDASCFFWSYWMFQANMALPKPETENEYVLFHLHYDSARVIPPVSLWYSEIDMSRNNGAGKVVRKNIPLIQGDFNDHLAAIRHGNGRDWWLVLTERQSADIVLFLFTKIGIEGPFHQKTPFGWITQVSPEVQASIHNGKAIFSPDGKLFARTDRRNKIQLYHFDRCTGEFFCPIEIDMEPAVDANFKPEWGKKFPNAHGLAFSPNSQFLYADNHTNLFQFDLKSADIQNSWELVGEYDGFADPHSNSFHQLLLAPDGKIYASASNGIKSLHVMHAPNELGKDCGFRNHDLPLIAYNGFCLPNYPNFRLYDWDKSPCDSLGINAPADSLVTVWHDSELLKIMPNPASEKVEITFPDICKGASATIFNVAGQRMLEIPFVKSGEPYEIDLRLWAAGVYFVSMFDGKKAWTTKKLVVLPE